MSFQISYISCYSNFTMGKARRNIIYDNSLIHVTFKCHNSSFYLKSDKVKKNVVEVIAKNKKKYGVNIFDWAILSNHVHYLVYVSKQDVFSNFMRTTNRAIARIINNEHQKTGQAIQDRYKSPVIENDFYCFNTIEYIWLNPVRATIVGLKNAHKYKYTSLFYKYRGFKDPISDSYELLEKLIGIKIADDKSIQKWAKDKLNGLLGKELNDLSVEVFQNSHSIGSSQFVENRRKLISEKSVRPP